MPDQPYDWARYMAREGHKLTPVPEPPKARPVKLASLQRLGLRRDGMAVREVWADADHEYLVNRHHRLAGHDACIVIEEGDQLGIYGWAAETPVGEFERLKAEQAERPNNGMGAVYGIER